MTGAQLVVETDPAEFRARVTPFLLQHEAENNLLFGILHGIERGRWSDPLMCRLQENGRIAAVAIRTPPHNLILSAAPAHTAQTLAGMLDPDLPGVNAEAGQSGAFADAWADRTGGSVRRETSMRIYRLTRVQPPAGVDGAARFAGPADTGLLAAWMEEFVNEALPPGDPNVGQAAERAEWYLSDADSGMLLWEVGGTPVCLAGHSGPTPNGMRIGPVYTPPQHRRRGYAAACVAELSARMLAAGRRFCFLYTDLANPTSNSVYQRIGYEAVSDAATYRFHG